MKIIGFQSGHDVSYCSLEDGVPTVHNEWERFLRCKEPQGDGLKFLFDKEEGTGFFEGVAFFTHGNPRTRDGEWAHRHNPDTGEWPCNVIEYENKMKLTGAPYHEISHHLSHAANAFFSSNFDKAMILTLDGGGWELKTQYDELEEDRITAGAVYYGEGTKLTPRGVSTTQELNLGGIWDRLGRDVLGLSWGYPGGTAAGTLMAMAALGTVNQELLREGLVADERVNFLKDWVGDDDQRKYDLAATLQFFTEEIIKNIIEMWIKEYKEETNSDLEYLCLAGGVALNSVCVGKIYIPPTPYDSGLAIGSAQYLYHHILDNPRVDWDGNASPYLGRPYSEDDVLLAVKDHDLDFERVTDEDVIDLISKDDTVISVFGGGSESGRRALGNRSILADPRSKTMKAVINEKVKHRQSFRPFAPSILREEVSNWFVRDVNSPYMSIVLPFKDEVVDKVPAVCHVDNTARLQTVTEKDNAWYYNFIKKFGEKTGVPILLNTSFNDREPIVETPDNAISCFQKTNIDYLYFFDCGILIKK